MQNQTKTQVHNLIILDESGSMQSIKNLIINGFNELIQTSQGIAQRFPDQAHYISFVSFNALERKEILFNAPIDSITPLDANNYNPNGGTPLFDAMGAALHKLKNILTPYAHVLVTILTDGEENASVEYNAIAIKALVEELKNKQWKFSYIGTEHDVANMAKRISIDNVKTFYKNEASMNKMFSQELREKEDFYGSL
jgi:hypothetical protein